MQYRAGSEQPTALKTETVCAPQGCGTAMRYGKGIEILPEDNPVFSPLPQCMSFSIYIRRIC